MTKYILTALECLQCPLLLMQKSLLLGLQILLFALRKTFKDKKGLYHIASVRFHCGKIRAGYWGVYVERDVAVILLRLSLFGIQSCVSKTVKAPVEAVRNYGAGNPDNLKNNDEKLIE